MPPDSLFETLAEKSPNDLLPLYLRYMTRKRTGFDAAELAAEPNWANANALRQYAHQLEGRWEEFVGYLRRTGAMPNLPRSAPGETEDRPGPSDLARLKADLENLAVKLDTSHILNG